MARKCYHKLCDNNGTQFFTNLIDDKLCSNCIADAKYEGKNYAQIKCPLDEGFCYVCFRKVKAGCIYVCGKDYGKRQQFVQDTDSITASLGCLNKLKANIEDVKNDELIARIRRTLHNIRTTNSHALQVMRAFIPESILRQHRRKSSEEVQDYVVKNIERTALTLFRLSKDLFEIKSEFSVYEKLVKGNTKLDKRPFNIRDIIMLVLYPFFEDFNKVDVYINVQNFTDLVPVDFETFQIAIYHVIENATKYVRPHSKASIYFYTDTRWQVVDFSMESLHIKENEAELLFQEGYSSFEARMSLKSGEGIGMYRTKRLIELNGGEVTFVPGADLIRENNLTYSHNNILIKIPLDIKTDG